MTFADDYGPWALVAGASDGVGAAFAEALAERGVNVVLLARRQALLDEVAAGIGARTGVETRAVAVDLAAPNAAATVAAATAGLEIGFLVYCAGADPNYEHFLANPIETAEAMVQRNCTVPMQLCHHYTPGMVERGRGGVILLGSAAGFAGAPNMVAYAATKAFDMVFAEALWAELRDKGVDVLGLVLGKTDTPTLRRLEHARGQLAGLDTAPSDAAAVSDVIAEGFDNLRNGPTWVVGEKLREAVSMMGSLPRNDLVRFMAQAAEEAMAGNGS
ncbi:SDR family NAD(P)-dependent oxidoreductase [Pseudofrankia inefficax]|uniref:Short-chain dehydrogenase/reductase SDR n=1 Tax=Pseudofrankia inefficax (strain DSM 45817 / CECT 9037 / DDB 130130 / EuI1c) TaxID=298654 RepID=E3JAM0_PSEI1|nr:SDR family NAD(P)-dependent oxidoreductase [Pseudofrankia inefficax]ADP82212.1 short-chain dehydrogenase/reductase SDR [Pseudofrankia inefficax]